MGTLEPMPTATWMLGDTVSGEVGLFLSSRAAEAIGGLESLPAGLSLRLHVLAGDAPVPPRAMDGLVAAVIELEGGRSSSLARLAATVRAHPGVPVIAALATADIGAIKTALREGADDVVHLPFSAEEIERAVLEIVARRSETADQKLAPAIAVVRSTGGCGATTVATNLAAALGQAGEQGRADRPLLVDLDVQFGDGAAYLGVEPTGSIVDLVRSTERIDAELVASIATPLDSFSVIAAPSSVTPFDAIELDSLLQVIRRLRGSCDAMIVELPANWSNWSLSLVSQADLILVVVELSVRSIAHARRTLDLFDAIGLPRHQVRLVVNKAEKRFFATLRSEDVEATLGVPVIGSLPADDSAVAPAQQNGEPVLAFAPRSKFAKAMTNLAAAVRSALPEGR